MIYSLFFIIIIIIFCWGVCKSILCKHMNIFNQDLVSSTTIHLFIHLFVPAYAPNSESGRVVLLSTCSRYCYCTADVLNIVNIIIADDFNCCIKFSWQCEKLRLSSIISQHTGVKFHFYADDTQLYFHLAHNNIPQAFKNLNCCLTDVKGWVSKCKLKLNPQKTEFIMFASKMQRDVLKKWFPIDILGSPLHPTD